ncbi:polysaccharide pyruvyl transferase family protein [Catalinimonas niigatensis]|uniref:polysaccharide pyruvyl transferase family protein n=1 Tax=Catalinimonas niigatensis TaxID=1397264 RepID=UPI002665C4EE|nr:polysaccharide pyruvyl transferase family protein [Catalinimonas niigatensis]WPP50428.1 polysaccharide pyruvyl transferase family protein [Catalinimonas niigatensis]
MRHKDFTRRAWLKKSGLLAGTALLSPPVSAMFRHLLKDKTILLHSGWQTVNIGDIGHTPGLIKVLQDFSPDTQVMLWPKSRLDRGAEAMLRKGFPKLIIVNGELNEQYQPSNPELKDAFAKADFMLHGSGPSVVGHLGLHSWRKATGKPYGLYGVTIQDIDPDLENLLKDAAFIYTRETHSLDRLAEKGIQGEHTGFTPDATFAMHLLDEQKAQKFLQQHKLQERQFICVIPRLRKTPYFKIYPDSGWSQQAIDEVNALNEKHKEKDHAKAREAMITYVRETGNKVLVCPEMTYQLDIMDELLIDPLPEDVRKNIVKRDTYWLPDEASAIYKHALAVVSFECHSPIMAFVNGTPAFYLRQPEDTIKGQMWYDIGVDDWVFEIEETQGKDITKQLMKVHADFESAHAYLQKAMNFVRQRHQQTMQFANQSFLKT